jgi:tetratricopeptide (TPR) repeat protein
MGALVWLLTLICPPIPQAAADTIVYATGKDLAGRSTMTGTVVDYTGEQLIIKTDVGVEQSIPTARIVEVKSEWTAAQMAGDVAFGERKYEEAARHYTQAQGDERREWARRQVMARRVRCYRNLGQIDQAGQAFLELIQSDPQTQHFAALPLDWTCQPPSPAIPQRAPKWLADPQNHVAVLLGASWLLPTAERSVALAALQRLSTDRDPRVAWLAQAQVWRTRVAAPEAQEIEGWERLLARIPQDLRAGPYFVLGQALANAGQHERAAQSLLRVPILYPADRPLAAAALLSAGQELEKIGQIREAVTLYREVVREHADAPPAAKAAGRLKALAGDEGG